MPVLENIGLLVTPVASISVTPANISLVVGATQQMTAVPRDVRGVALVGRTVRWASSNTNLATVDNNGLVTAIALGSFTITALSEAVSTQTPGATTLPTTPQELMTYINFLGGNGTTGFVFTDLSIFDGTMASAATRTVSVDGTSPTGFKCTIADNLANPSAGQHFRPSASRPAGAVCTASGALVDGAMEIPGASTGSIVTGTADTAPATVPNSGGMLDYLASPTLGITFGAVVKQKADFTNNPVAFRVGEAAANNEVSIAQTFPLNYEWIGNSNPRAAMFCGGGGNNFVNHGSDWIHVQRYVVNSPQNYNGRAWSYFRYTRDLYAPADGTDALSDLMTAGRRIALMINNPAGDTGQQLGLFYAGHGMLNQAQSQALDDAFARMFPTIIEDTTPIGLLLGCSFIAQITNGSLLSQGENGSGAPAGGTAAFCNLALGGRTNSHMYAWYHVLARTDHSKRSNPIIPFIFNDQQNSGVDPLCMTQIEFGNDQIRSLPNHKALLFDETFFQEADPTVGLPAARLAEMRANFAAHSTYLLDIAKTTAFDSQYIIAPKDAIYWSGDHPTALTQVIERVFVRQGFSWQWGLLDPTNVSAWARPAAGQETKNISAGSPTFTMVPTANNLFNAPLGGKTFSFTSSNTGVATVNIATGVVTRAGAGTCYIQAVANDGGAIAIVKVVSS